MLSAGSSPHLIPIDDHGLRMHVAAGVRQDTLIGAVCMHAQQQKQWNVCVRLA